jgi:signal transduction histidine kinase
VRARAATSDGPGITLRLQPQLQEGVRIEVADRGIGIPEADVGKIFDPFFTRRPGGSGLGLAIARNVIEALGGTIAAISTPGEGTVITIDLPNRAIHSERLP